MMRAQKTQTKKQGENKSDAFKIAMITAAVAIITTIITAVVGPLTLKSMERTPVPIPSLTSTPTLTSTQTSIPTSTPTQTPTPTSPPTQTPTPTLAPTPTPVEINTNPSKWGTYADSLGSSIEGGWTPGHADPHHILGFWYDLKENGYVGFFQDIAPGMLSDTSGISFYTISEGSPNTIELKLLYVPDAQGISTVFSILWHRATGTDDYFEAPFDQFVCWEATGCVTKEKLELQKVKRIDFAISNKPGDSPGAGTILIEGVKTFTLIPSK